MSLNFNVQSNFFSIIIYIFWARPDYISPRARARDRAMARAMARARARAWARACVIS